MSKLTLIFFCLVFLFSSVIVASDCLKLLKIQEPPQKAKNRLMLNMGHLNEIVAGFNLDKVSAVIELVDQDENVLAVLGKIKHGQIKWGHKADASSLLVKFKRPGYENMMARLKEKKARSGLRILASTMDKDQHAELKTTLQSCDITFAEFSDLAVMMKFPIKAKPGQELANEITLTIENRGTTPASNFDVRVVLSSDTDISQKPAEYNDEFTDDMMLKEAKEIVGEIKPGENLTFNFKGSLKIPPVTPPGNYYLAAVVDGDNKVEELDEKNNKDTRLFLVALPEPKKVVVELPNTQLIYRPTTFGLSIDCDGVPLSDGKDWRKCNVKPYQFQVKHAAFEDFFWEIDTQDRGTWQVTGAKFCKKGGKAKEVKIKMSAKGGSKTAMPSWVILKLLGTRIEYEPNAGKFRLSAPYAGQLTYVPFWKIVRVKSHLYQLQHQLWQDTIWELDAFKKEVRSITGGKLGHEGGTPQKLDYVITVER